MLESNCDEFAPGDRVACGGAGIAVHAEILSVPKNLALKIPDDVAMDDASYTTVASIAMQGFRQAEAALGENVAVIGLGLLGQITIKLLKSAGCRVAGMDIEKSLFARAKDNGCDLTLESSFDSVDSIMAFTNGLGCDSVIITASTASNQPVELAMEIARKKGKIVIVGAVGMDLPRSPFYQKELDVRISCSYGPGRYDADYEERGRDYPPAYVRWTENRNMQAFLDLIAAGKIEVNSLTTHTFDINEAAEAYKLVTGESKEEYLGIILKYPERKESLQRTFSSSSKNEPLKELNIAFIGAGTFAQSSLLHPLKSAGAGFQAVTTSTPVNAKTVADHFGFKKYSTDSSEIIKGNDNNAVFIATQHDTHAKYVIEAVESGKPVFVEKPLAVDINQLEKIKKAEKEYNGRIMVGFNRRFSKAFTDIYEFLEGRTAPMNILYRVNAGKLPKTHWIFTPENRGRIIGEGCHFIDTMVFLTNSLPETVYAKSIAGNDVSAVNRDNVSITIRFRDGSVGTVLYLANSGKNLPKEYCEVHCEQSSAIMNNFKTTEFLRGGRSSVKKYSGDKGHKEEIIRTAGTMKSGLGMPISFEELVYVTQATFSAVDSLDKGREIEIIY